MKVLVFQHVAVETPGGFLDHMAAHGDRCDIVSLQEGERIPDLAPYDILIVMGGPMGVWEIDENPWLTDEKAAIRHWVLTLGRPFFGICLGHQLLVDALGGNCACLKPPEIGVLTVDMTEAAATDPMFSTLPGKMPCVQWHGVHADMLPEGTTVLAQSQACAVQAIRVGDAAWGVQFHPEVKAGTITDWMSGDANHQCAVDWLGSAEAAMDMQRGSDAIAAELSGFSAAMYKALRGAVRP